MANLSMTALEVSFETCRDLCTVADVIAASCNELMEEINKIVDSDSKLFEVGRRIEYMVKAYSYDMEDLLASFRLSMQEMKSEIDTLEQSDNA